MKTFRNSVVASALGIYVTSAFCQPLTEHQNVNPSQAPLCGRIELREHRYFLKAQLNTFEMTPANPNVETVFENATEGELVCVNYSVDSADFGHIYIEAARRGYGGGIRVSN